jgi:DNA-binding HxlR family transcriptional regulator
VSDGEFGDAVSIGDVAGDDPHGVRREVSVLGRITHHRGDLMATLAGFPYGCAPCPAARSDNKDLAHPPTSVRGPVLIAGRRPDASRIGGYRWDTGYGGAVTEPLDPDMFDPVCPSDLSPVRVGDKWAGMIIRCLEQGPRRFSELRIPLHGITAKVLTQSLRALQRDGLITRTAYCGPPRRVEYELTPLGRSLLEPMAAVCTWAQDHWDEILDAREASSPLGRTG